ncbi:heart- and neural crest derivatives-expressed protein 2 isoform X1 [Oryzias latipes]|uniref:heart- and neural crest derivatives-expressed protein 2 isoform X1 n=1 Tax=Oryzias latipes TaxID=8090 RepID=UPI000CE18E24|nr:heart- and neural crest derivatives-expressed protein 2 isoform X1 [Oryzias latipes]
METPVTSGRLNLLHSGTSSGLLPLTSPRASAEQTPSRDESTLPTPDSVRTSTSDATGRSLSISGPPETVPYLTSYLIKSPFLLPSYLSSVSHSGFQHLGLCRSVAMTERTGLNPDPADPEGLRLAVSQQGIMLGRQADALSQMAAAQQDLFHRLDGLTQTLHDLTGHFSHVSSVTAQASTSSAPSTSGLPSAHENIRLQPEPFSGDVEACGGFLLQCQLIYQQAPRHYQSDHSKISLIVNSLRNKALQWAQAYLSANPISHITYERFLREFQLIFDQPRKQEEATRRLLALRQRNRSVSDHVVDFRILAVEAGWPDLALKGIFYQSLNEQIKDHLCSQPEAQSFEELVSAALRSDVRLRERQRERAPDYQRAASMMSSVPHTVPVTSPNPLISSKPPEEPMQIGHSRLSEEERRRRREEGACFYCGAKGHIVNTCPLRLNTRAPR